MTACRADRPIRPPRRAGVGRRSGAIMGAGAAKRLSAVRWGVAGNIFAAWILTLPCSAAVGALTYGVVRMFGTGSAGPIVVVVVLLIGLLVFAAVQLCLGWSGLRWIRHERERVVSQAAEQSRRERLRVASDLHDGVLQDLVGASYVVAGAVAPVRRLGGDDVAEGLTSAADGIRTNAVAPGATATWSASVPTTASKAVPPLLTANSALSGSSSEGTTGRGASPYARRSAAPTNSRFGW